MHAKLQLEGVIDCLQFIFPAYDFDLLCNQSSGHTKMREDELSASNMNMSNERAVLDMHDTIIHEVGPFRSILKAGNTQIMTFGKPDKGPFWMDPISKLEYKYDHFTRGTQNNEKTKAMMLEDLCCHGVDTSSHRFLKEELLELCRENNANSKIISKNNKKGWVGAPKGLLQILYEQGWINS